MACAVHGVDSGMDGLAAAHIGAENGGAARLVPYHARGASGRAIHLISGIAGKTQPSPATM